MVQRVDLDETRTFASDRQLVDCFCRLKELRLEFRELETSLLQLFIFIWYCAADEGESRRGLLSWSWGWLVTEVALDK